MCLKDFVWDVLPTVAIEMVELVSSLCKTFSTVSAEFLSMEILVWFFDTVESFVEMMRAAAYTVLTVFTFESVWTLAEEIESLVYVDAYAVVETGFLEASIVF